MQCDVTRCIVCISNKVESQQGAELQKFYQRSYIVNLSDLCNAIKKLLDKIRVIATLHTSFVAFDQCI